METGGGCTTTAGGREKLKASKVFTPDPAQLAIFVVLVFG